MRRLNTQSKGPNEPVQVELYNQRQNRYGYYLQVNDKKFEKDLNQFSHHAKALNHKSPGVCFLLRAHKNVQFNHIFQVYNQCLIAGVRNVQLDYTP